MTIDVFGAIPFLSFAAIWGAMLVTGHVRTSRGYLLVICFAPLFAIETSRYNSTEATLATTAVFVLVFGLSAWARNVVVVYNAAFPDLARAAHEVTHNVAPKLQSGDPSNLLATSLQNVDLKPTWAGVRVAFKGDSWSDRRRKLTALIEKLPFLEPDGSAKNKGWAVLALTAIGVALCVFFPA